MSDINGTLRAMAWERAKAELRSVLVTYHGEQEKFEAMDDATVKFIDFVESHGLAE